MARDDGGVISFRSDNAAPIAPEIIDALVAANEGLAPSYDADRYSQRLDAVYSDYFETPVRVFAVSTGTAANALALSVLVPPYGAVICHEEAHIHVDEAGAPEFFTNGAKLLLAKGAGAKLTADALDQAAGSLRGDVHTVQPRAVSITQASELGRSYTPDEIADLSGICRAGGLALHMDGARFANALVHLGCSPADMTWRAGVDVLSFGTTKNGTMNAEAVIFFNPDQAGDIANRRKRAGHLLSKGRYLSAQLLAYIETGVWQRNAQHANAGAARIGAVLGDRLTQPVEANEVFARLDPADVARLRAAGIDFYDWGEAGGVRFVVSWCQPLQEIEALCRMLDRGGGQAAGAGA